MLVEEVEDVVRVLYGGGVQVVVNEEDAVQDVLEEEEDVDGE